MLMCWCNCVNLFVKFGIPTAKTSMKHISILVPYEAVPAAIVDPRYMFSTVNVFLKDMGREPAFIVQLVGLDKHVPLNDGVFSVNTDCLCKDVSKTDIIII